MVSQTSAPEWVSKLSNSIKAGRNVNVLHFNVEDDLIYVGKKHTVKEVVEEVLNKKGVITYSLSGFRFSDDETELAFRHLTGLPMVPAEPGPMPVGDEVTEQQKLDWKDEYDYYQEWLAFSTEQMSKFGRTPVGCLAPIPVDEPYQVMQFLQTFVTSRPLEGATDKQGRLYENPTDYTLVIDYATFIVPDSGDKAGMGAAQKKLEVLLTEWSSQGRDGVQIVLYASALADVSKSLYGRGSLVGVVEVPYPDFDTRYAYLKVLQQETHFKMNGASLEELARVASGLSNRHIHSLVVECTNKNAKLDSATIRHMKQDILTEELVGTVELVVPDHGFETIGGLDDVKAALYEVAGYIENESYGLCPMGILLVGPPGTGKTYIAEAFANKLGFNFIRPGAIKSKWVGESKRNQDKLFQTAKALAPVVIFMDEIDQESGREAEGDAGVSKELFGGLLRFMSDTSNRGRILVVAASNRPDLIDPAMKRPGRFDIRIPLLYPDKVERAEIFKVMFKKYDLIADPNVNFEELSKLTDGYSGADIECVVLEAARIADRADKYPTVGMSHLIGAVDDYITHYDHEAIEKMEVLAAQECNSIHLLPERYRDAVKKQKAEQSAEFGYEDVGGGK